MKKSTANVVDIKIDVEIADMKMIVVNINIMVQIMIIMASHGIVEDIICIGLGVELKDDMGVAGVAVMLEAGAPAMVIIIKH